MKTIKKIILLVVAIAMCSCSEKKQVEPIALPTTLADSVEDGKDALLSFGSMSEKRFYVTSENMEHAISKFNGEMVDSMTVAFTFNKKSIEFQITPMEKLDFGTTLKEGDFGTWKDMVCEQVVDETLCMDYVDENTNKFLFSLKVPKGGLSYCTPKKNEECEYVWVTFKERTYAQPGCKGPPAGNQLIRICYDNRS